MPGPEFGRYRVLRCIGTGGMGEVYSAHDTQLDRDIALKILPAKSFADSKARQRMIEEARSASALNHPNICAVYEVGDVDGQLFLAMEFVDGLELSNAIRPGGLPFDLMTDYGIQLAEALDHAHEHGVVHRDLKASNVMITSQGRVKLLDFGLAKRTLSDAKKGPESTVTSSDPVGITGTLSYIAPEILSGEAGDARSDIWALGVLLYEMATSQRPFVGRTPYEVASAILHHQPASLADRVSPQFDLIVRRCLQKDPRRRYQRASEVRAALEAIRPTLQPSRPHILSGKHGIKGWLIAGCAAVVILSSIVLFKAFTKRGGAPIRSLAVLPLRNLSDNTEQEYFADGMTDQLITQLGSISALKVISRTSVMRYKNTRETVPQIANELGVDGIVEGSILRDANQVRVTVQLTDARTNNTVWAHSYERNLHDIVTLQDDLAVAIAWQIQAKLTPTEKELLSTAKAVNPEAYELYLQGRFFWSLRTPLGFNKAVPLFRQAINKDPNYSPAYSGLADTYILLQDYGLLSPDEAFPLAKSLASKAIELNETLPEAHTSLGGILQDYERDWEGAEREYKHSIELNPNYATAYQWYGTLLSVLGRHEEAIEREKQASELAPLSTRVAIDLGYALFHARKYSDALVQGNKALDLDGNSISANRLLGEIYLAQGQWQEAVQHFQTAVELSKNAETDRAFLGYAFAKMHKNSSALAILKELQSRPPTSIPHYHIAMIYAALGENENALAALEQASLSQRDKWIQYANVEEAFEPIRSSPAFIVILRRLRLPQRSQ